MSVRSPMRPPRWSRKDADTLCRDRWRLAIQVSNVCDMTRCFTDYQCVTKAEVEIIVR